MAVVSGGREASEHLFVRSLQQFSLLIRTCSTRPCAARHLSHHVPPIAVELSRLSASCTANRFQDHSNSHFSFHRRTCKPGQVSKGRNKDGVLEEVYECKQSSSSIQVVLRDWQQNPGNRRPL